MNRRAMAELRTILRRALGPAIAFGLGLATYNFVIVGGGKPTETPPLANAAIGGEFALQDKTGKTVRFSDFEGKYRVVYFGYTFCPDVCPVDLQNLMQGLNQLAKTNAEAAAKVQPIFITVDPKRDTPQVVGEFAANFGPKLIGLTGTEEAIKAAEKSFAVYAEKREGGSADAYLMDHSRATYLMGPKGEPLALIPTEQNPQAVAAELAKWVK